VHGFGAPHHTVTGRAASVEAAGARHRPSRPTPAMPPTRPGARHPASRARCQAPSHRSAAAVATGARRRCQTPGRPGAPACHPPVRGRRRRCQTRPDQAGARHRPRRRRAGVRPSRCQTPTTPTTRRCQAPSRLRSVPGTQPQAPSRSRSVPGTQTQAPAPGRSRAVPGTQPQTPSRRVARRCLAPSRRRRAGTPGGGRGCSSAPVPDTWRGAAVECQTPVTDQRSLAFMKRSDCSLLFA
jgi:hypothetical protein